MTGARRLPALLAIAGLLIAGGLADRAGRPRAAAGGRVPAMAVAPPSSALASEWYCPAVEANPAGAVSGAIILANPGGRDVRGTVTLVPADNSPPARVAVEVKAVSRSVIDVRQHT